MHPNDEDRDQLDRRKFGALAVAAFGGLMAGCDSNEPSDTGNGGGGDEGGGDEGGGDEGNADKNPLLVEPHVCCGLNTCKGKGAGKENACAGQGTCATAKAHSCHFENECRGQGGCGEKPGENACKGKGECAVPLGEDAWKKARARFEELMKAEGKEVGAAPDCPKEG